MKAPPVTRIIIKRFRSFPTATLVFDNPLFVVGRNGSGKSNLADAFSFVSEAMSSPLQAVFDRRGGIGAIRNRSSGQSFPPNLGLAFEFGPVNGIDGGRFAFEVKALPNYGYRIVHEQCLVRKNDGNRWWFDRADKWKSNVEGLTPALEPSALALPLVGGDERFRAGTKNVSERFPNLTVKKIPKQVLSRCEWGHDDYSLIVENLPKAPPPPPKTDKRGQQALQLD